MSRSFLVAAALSVALSGCGYATMEHPFDTASFTQETGWISVADVPLIKQQHEADCGAAAAAMLLTYWNKPVDSETVWAAAHPAAGHGIEAGWIRDYVKAQGLTAFLLSGTQLDLEKELAAGHPLLVGTIVGINDKDISHYEVVVGINKARHLVVTLDPARGTISRSLEDFLLLWRPSEYLTLVVYQQP